MAMNICNSLLLLVNGQEEIKMKKGVNEKNSGDEWPVTGINGLHISPLQVLASLCFTTTFL